MGEGLRISENCIENSCVKEEGGVRTIKTAYVSLQMIVEALNCHYEPVDIFFKQHNMT